ncbi:MAG: F0F1 ATP synthase subunit gamma, partial [Gammaproteobacteria bacterium]|nr:F0F1 ATP synthase subunit gamma [Gammaproteobacteria bacterium]
MSKRHDLQNHIKSLNEISEIMASIKTLSMLEMHKIAQALKNQERIVSNIEAMAKDFANHYFLNFPATKQDKHCLLVLGSERGFCGGFNEMILQSLEQKLASNADSTAGIIAVGQKICSQLADHPKLLASLSGVSVLEESGDVIQNILNNFKELQLTHHFNSLEVLFYEHKDESIKNLHLFPPFRELKADSSVTGFPPILNLDESTFLNSLIDQFLFFRVYEMIYSSAMIENQQRIR